MFCPKCGCEFVGWTGDCPDCGIPLVNERPPRPVMEDRTISYNELVDLLRDCGGRMTGELSTTDIGTEREWGFPYFGYGLAWAEQMNGNLNDVSVEFNTTEIGTEKNASFPYLGRGFAWAKRMQGHIGGNMAWLTVDRVEREKAWRFPYLGHGYAWMEEMSGECGDQIKVGLLVIDIGRKREWKFPYRGYGFAWADRARLTLSLRT